jgi:RNA polymerase sigma factor (sigma-70 family)
VRSDVWWAARKHLPCDADADGVVQRVFTRMWQHGVDVWRPRRPRAFFRRAGRTEALYFLRGRHRRAISFDDIDPTAFPASEALPDELASRDEVRAIVRAAIDELPPRCAQVMTLIGEGFTHAEVAAQLDITVEAVYKQAVRGRRLLGCSLEWIHDRPGS